VHRPHPRRRPARVRLRRLVLGAGRHHGREGARGPRPHTRGATTIIVAQRISTITSADQILVLEEGRIVGRGTHEELLESSETYREIVDSQITAEEMA
jgi:ABC-type multidrug transport system, ATPase and permease components